MNSSSTSSRKKCLCYRLLPSGIRARLFLLILLVLLPEGLFLAWTYNERYQARRSQVMVTELEVAQGVAMAFSGYVDGIWRQNHSLGQAIMMFSPPVLPKATRLLTVSATQYASVRNLSWVNPRGVIVASSQSSMLGKDVSGRGYFRRITAGEEWTLGRLTSEGIVAKSPTFVIATACRGRDGTLQGVVIAGIEPERLGELTLTQRRPGGSAYAIFDNHGTLVYHNQFHSPTWKERIEWRQTDPVLQSALRTGAPHVGVISLALRQGRWISARAPMTGIGWVAGAGSPLSSALAPVKRDMIQEVTMSLFALLLAFALAYMVALTIARPLQNLEMSTRQIDQAGQTTPDDPLAPVEVRRLSEVIAEMAVNIRAGERRFRLALENLPDLVLICDNEQRVQYVNLATLRAMGVPSSHLLGRHEREIWPDIYQQWQPALEKALETGSVQTIELEVHGAGGNRFFHVTYVPIVVHEGQVREIMSISHDYTVRKQAEDELKKALEELLRSNRDLEQFAYVASHDLQEPLRMVTSYVQLLERRYSSRLDEKALTYMNYVVSGAKRMQSLIEDLLAYGRLNRGMHIQAVDLNLILEEVLDTLSPAITDSGATIEKDALPTIRADRAQIAILLQNLIGNAIKYHRKGISPIVRIGARKEGSEWLFSVQDNGIGIEAAYFGRIFDIFQRLHAREEYAGTGIGLATSKRIVEQHLGRIWLESEPGRGTTFYFTIPA